MNAIFFTPENGELTLRKFGETKLLITPFGMGPSVQPVLVSMFPLVQTVGYNQSAPLIPVIL